MNRLAIVLVPSLLLSSDALAQGWSSLKAFSTVKVVAAKRGTVEVSIRNVPLVFDFDAQRQSGSLIVPVTTKWNVSPTEVNGIQLIGYFDDPDRALTSENGDALPSRNVFARIGTGPLQAFNQTNSTGPAGGSLNIFSENISATNTRSSRQDNLELSLDDAFLRDKPPSRYVGVLHLEARYF